MKVRVYISGPMSGIPRRKYMRDFGIAERILKAHGYKTINPCRVWSSRWPWLYRIVGYRLTLLYDLWLLMSRADAIVFLPNHYISRGSCIEDQVSKYFYMSGIPKEIRQEINDAINNSDE